MSFPRRRRKLDNTQVALDAVMTTTVRYQSRLTDLIQGKIAWQINVKKIVSYGLLCLRKTQQYKVSNKRAYGGKKGLEHTNKFTAFNFTNSLTFQLCCVINSIAAFKMTQLKLKAPRKNGTLRMQYLKHIQVLNVNFSLRSQSALY